LVWTLVIWVWEFEFGFSNIKQKIWFDEKGNGNCWFHYTICYTNIQLTSDNQNKWTTKKTHIGNNKQHFQTSNLHFNSKQWPLWNKFWYVKLTLKSFVPKSCHSKTRKKNDNYISKPSQTLNLKTMWHSNKKDIITMSKNFWTHPKIATSNQQACKGKNAAIFQNILNTKKCIKSFQNTTYNF